MFNDKISFDIPQSYDYHQILIFINHGGSHILGDIEYPITDYSIHFVPRGIIHALKDAANHSRLKFHKEYFENCPIKKSFIDSLPFFSQRSDGCILTFQQDTFLKIKNLIGEIIEEYTERCKEKRRCEILQTLIHLFLLECNKKGRYESLLKPEITPNVVPEMMEKLLSAIEIHYKKRWQVKQYAAHLYISTSQLNRYCQTVFQKSVQDLIQERSLKEAKTLLIQTQVAIKEISWELGFEHPSNFISFFTKKVGVSPTQFRKKSA